MHQKVKLYKRGWKKMLKRKENISCRILYLTRQLQPICPTIKLFYKVGCLFSVKLTEKVDDEMRRRIIKAEIQEFGLLPDDSEVIASGVDLKKYLG